MTVVDTEETLVAAQRGTDRPSELHVDDRPECPSCGAEAAMQATVSRVPDGALELAILVCTQCAKDHPVWF